MEELMRVEGLKMYFGGLKAIDGFDLTINKGETLGIIGPNGAGKTTLFNAICGVYKPTDGKVFLEGKEVQGTPAHEMAKMGIAKTRLKPSSRRPDLQKWPTKKLPTYPSDT